MKQYVGFVTDHSISMERLTNGAMKDFNLQVEQTRASAGEHQIDTVVSRVLCGWSETIPKKDSLGWATYGDGKVKRDIVNSSVHILKPITEYEVRGASTPLFDSVWELIDIMEMVPDKDDPNVAFLINVITDGKENYSRHSSSEIASRIRRLQSTGRWTFVFRVPQGYKYEIIYAGIPAGNVLEWEQTEKGLDVAAYASASATDNYFRGRTRGIHSTSSFFADMRNVKLSDIKRSMKDITKKISVFPVSKFSNTAEIRTFIERQLGEGNYLRGAAFFQLTKSEKVQPNKQLVIIDKDTGKIYGGYDARYALGLPDQGDIRLKPGDTSHYEVYVQSTSVNRKLVGGTKLVYWPGAVLKGGKR